MKQPSICLDTTIFSVLFYGGHDVLTRARKASTRIWWDKERRFFEMSTSQVTEDELSQGTYLHQERALAACRVVRFLPWSSEVRECAQAYEEEEIVPKGQRGDALQLAFSTVCRQDYLLSWNHAHLVNEHTAVRLRNLCARKGWRFPVAVSPDTIPKVGLGQEIRRRD